MAIKVYQYPACGTCKKALKWLKEQGLAFDSVDIVREPPSKAVLERALASGYALKQLFNTSGESYRNGGFKDKLQAMSKADALAALTADGKLVKRPVLVTGDAVLVGFDEAAWEKTLA